MRPETLQSYARAVPFRPFRIVLTDGEVFDVSHPNYIRVCRDEFLYFYAESPDAPFDRFDIRGLVLIDKVEPVETTAASSSSGK